MASECLSCNDRFVRRSTTIRAYYHTKELISVKSTRCTKYDISVLASKIELLRSSVSIDRAVRRGLPLCRLLGVEFMRCSRYRAKNLVNQVDVSKGGLTDDDHHLPPGQLSEVATG
jgi:hypothetical protein